MSFVSLLANSRKHSDPSRRHIQSQTDCCDDGGEGDNVAAVDGFVVDAVDVLVAVDVTELSEWASGGLFDQEMVVVVDELAVEVVSVVVVVVVAYELFVVVVVVAREVFALVAYEVVVAIGILVVAEEPVADVVDVANEVVAVVVEVVWVAVDGVVVVVVGAAGAVVVVVDANVWSGLA